jgi:hypothetical protein
VKQYPLDSQGVLHFLLSSFLEKPLFTGVLILGVSRETTALPFLFQ